MPLYCTVDDLGRFGVNAQAIEDLAREENQEPPIAARSAFIDSYLNRVFTMPILVWGADVKECCAVLVAWDVISVRGFKPGENTEDHPLRVRYEDMITWLDMIAKGQVKPVLTDSSPVPPGGGGSGSTFRPRAVSNAQRGWQSDDDLGGPFTGRRR